MFKSLKLLVLLIEDMENKWSRAKETVQGIIPCLTQTNEQLNTLESTLCWRHYAIARGAGEMEGGGNTDQ